MPAAVLAPASSQRVASGRCAGSTPASQNSSRQTGQAAAAANVRQLIQARTIDSGESPAANNPKRARPPRLHTAAHAAFIARARRPESGDCHARNANTTASVELKP